MMIPRVLETEVMDSALEAADYDAMDHRDVNRRFVEDLLTTIGPDIERGEVLDLGTGTGLIPIELAGRSARCRVCGVDLAQPMLARAVHNISGAGLTNRIRLALLDAKGLSFEDATFGCVISNSLVHHIPNPYDVLSEAVRVTCRQGWLFFRDLVRPNDSATVRSFVEQYAGDANAHQQQMFADSLCAALTLGEIRDLVAQLGFARDTVQMTSDRHWTWAVQLSG